DDLLVVAGEHRAAGEGGVGPDDLPAAGLLRRLEDAGAVDLLVPLRRQPGDDQVALVVEEEEAVALPHQERGRQEGLLPRRRGPEVLPHLLSGVGLETAQLPAPADAV